MSLRFQADADLNYTIVKAVPHREPSIDFTSAADSSLEGVSDPEVLERAAQEGRILVSHDRRPMLAHFRARLEAEKSSPGLFVVSQGVPLQLLVNALTGRAPVFLKAPSSHRLQNLKRYRTSP